MKAKDTHLEDRQALSLTDVPQPHSAVSASTQEEECPVPAQVYDVCCVPFQHSKRLRL
jgi:hypothetical protein